ncbi:MAG: ABC transporter permease subunit [Streptosporangiales bacterium]|nr:ABC transporter permease subunit [Streptosporangiales bacterium]
MSTHDAGGRTVTVPPGRAGQAPTGRRRQRPRLGTAYSATATVVLLALGVLLWFAGSAGSWWSAATLPAPADVAAAFPALAESSEFWRDTGRTFGEITLSFAAGSFLGLLAGTAFWKLPTVGRVFEPYLVSFYAVPMVLFYPVMIVVLGINQWPVVVLATVMAFIPMALNSWVGLQGLPPVYLKLARSLRCTPTQTLFQVALPGAAPYILAGTRLAAVYALIGTVAMEFTTASAGLGFRIRYLYEAFDNVTMFAYIVVVLTLSLVVTALLALLEWRLMRRRSAT